MIATTFAQAEAAIRAAKPGEVVSLVGTFDYVPLKYRQPGLVLDMTKAEVLTQTRTGAVAGLHIMGGTWRQGLSFGGTDITVEDALFEGGEDRAWNGIGLQGAARVTIRRNRFVNCQNAIVLNDVDGFTIDDNQLERLRRDGINLTACRNGTIRRNTLRDHRPVAGDHPDGVQMLNLLGKPATENLLFEDNDLSGPIQGITPTHKAASGAPRFRNITYRRNRIVGGHPYGLGVVATDGAVLDGNSVSTLEGSPYQSRIVVSPDSTDVTFIGENTQAAYRNDPAKAYAPTVAPPAPPPVDPKDARIAGLEAEIAKLEASLMSMSLSAANLTEERDRLAGVIATVRQAVA